jgi:hypothetical protein
LRSTIAKREEQSIDLQRPEISAAATPLPSLPMNALWRTIRGYILWSYERGTLHYDIMVTLILIFVFLSPYWINFNDKPAPRVPHPKEVIVTSDAQGSLLYQIDAAAVSVGGDKSVRDQLVQVIEPISGPVSIVKYEPVTDRKGHVQSYKVWVHRGQ